MIPFCKTYLSGNEAKYLAETLSEGRISGNGKFSKSCHNFFELKYGFKKCLLTSSGTSALEMAALLLNIGPGDEVIIPSYTFSATANAFILRGAKIIFADSSPKNPNINPKSIDKLISKKTKAIVVVHYAGIACDMESIQAISKKHNIAVVEDAAHAIDGYYKEKPLGSIGSLAAFSFHQTKNIVAGECGLLVINDPDLMSRAEILWENGTNRAAFYRGEVDKYTWVDMGSSFLASELLAAFLWAQLEKLEVIQTRRKEIWNMYASQLAILDNTNGISTPYVPKYAGTNGHLFYLLCNDENQRDQLISYLRAEGIYAVFHYNSLHLSPYFSGKHEGDDLPNADRYTQTLVRLPLFFELSDEQILYICNRVKAFFITTS
ncbi:MAG: dTDP-4-amino-4,6-dideoxygalactose transaminase [Cytophagia bacterium]|nr:dTDP-4-amino-4,6-dideoxygalactose transaminase [Cytophagia bacterium]